jgi:hypothetical protein
MDSQTPPKPPPNAKIFWLIWGAVAVFAVSAPYFLIKTFFSSFGSSVYRQTAQGWEALPKAGNLTHQVRISPTGVVWVQTIDGLSRLERDTWHPIRLAKESGILLPNFALDGEEVWAASSEGVVRYDGTRWRLYRMATGTLPAIAAANGEVWLMSHDGNLSHFDGKTWTTRKLDLPPSPKHLALAATAKGPLWISWQGLWRFSAGTCTRIAGVSADATLLGANPPGTWIQDGEKIAVRAGVWVHDGNAVVEITSDGTRAVRYTMHDLGLQDSAHVFAVAARVPYFAVASSQGVVSFDGTRWHFDQPFGRGGFSHVELAPDGSVWGIGTNATALPGWAPWLTKVALAGSLIFPVGLMISAAWYLRRRTRYQRYNMRDAVLHATGSLPEELQKPTPSGINNTGGYLIVLALGMAGYWVTRRLWPAAPTWLLPLYFLATHLIATVSGALKKRKPLPSDPIGPGGPSRYDWARSWPAILGGVAVVLLLYGGSIARMLHIPWMSGLGLGLLIGGFVLWNAYDTFRGTRIEREIKRCDYTRALEMLDGLWGWPSTGLMKLERADALFFSGRIFEAEAVLNDLMDERHDAGHKTLVFEHLGRVLIARGLWDGARKMFEGAAKLMPNRSAAYSGLAEIRLIQGVEPTKALADAEQALQMHRRSMLEKKAARERLCTIRGNQAWALAMMGRGADAQKAIEEGIRDAGTSYLPEIAGLYWRAGMAMVALENMTAATGFFRKSAEIDPKGYYGKLAAQRLSEHSVWGAAALAHV